MSDKDIYIELAKKLGAPTSKRFLAILDAVMTPDEAKMCMQLFAPATAKEVAAALKMDEKVVKKSLDSMEERSIVTKGKTQYAFHTTLLGFHHDLADTGPHGGPHPMSQKIKDLWADFFYNEWAEDWVKMASDRKKGGGNGIMLTPAITALEISGISPKDLLPQENWKQQIETAKRRIVAPCGCRILWGKCDHPKMTCFAVFDNTRGEYYLNKPGRLLKEYSKEEVLKIVRENEELGLIHWGVCYCCKDACEMLHSYTKYNRLDLVEPNRFEAKVDQETCIGCQVCVDKCPFNAIEMVKVPGSKKLKAQIIPENCKGCGVCVVGCKQKALKLEIVRSVEYFESKQFRMPPPPKDEPGKPTKKIKVGAYGGFYELD